MNIPYLPSHHIRFLLVILLWGALTAGAKEFTVSGTIKTREGDPLPDATFTLIGDNDDSEQAARVTSDEDGAYEISVQEGQYYMRVSCQGYRNSSGQLDVDEDIIGLDILMIPDPEAKTKDLEEVEVIAKALQTYADRDEMYLTAYNRKYGVNALDAISSLPRFIPSINGETLMNNKMEDVSILINGRKASADDLRNLNGKDIAKVIYYQDAPARYRGLYGGAVANVILKRPKELRLNGKLDASTALTAASTSDGVGFTLFSPSGLLNVSYKFSYSNFSNYYSREAYDYGDLINSFTMTSGRGESKSNRANISYQFEKGSNLFYASFTYRGGDIHNNMTYDLLEQATSLVVTGRRKSVMHPVSDNFNLNLYYSRDFGAGRELMVDLVGSIGKNRRNLLQQQTTGAGSAYNNYLYDTSTDGHVRSIIANASYSTPLWGGMASASLLEQYRHVKQNYLNNLFPDLPSLNISSGNYTMLSLDYNRMFGDFGMNMSLSFFDNLLKTTDGKTHNDFYVYPKFNLSYQTAQWSNIQLTGWMEGTLTGMGKQNVNRYLIDTRYYRENIPYLKPAHRYNIDLSADFDIAAARLMITPDISYTWERNGYIEYIYREDNVFVQRPMPLHCNNRINYNLFVIWMPVDNLQIRPYFFGSYKAFRTPEGPVRFHSTRFRLLASYTIKQLQFQALVTSPEKEVQGITHSYRGWNFNIDAYWNPGKFYIGVGFSYAGQKSWSSMEVPGFSRIDETQNLDMRNFVTLSLGYNFQIGKYHRNTTRRKRLNNEETEKGL